MRTVAEEVHGVGNIKSPNQAFEDGATRSITDDVEYGVRAALLQVVESPTDARLILLSVKRPMVTSLSGRRPLPREGSATARIFRSTPSASRSHFSWLNDGLKKGTRCGARHSVEA